MFYSPRNRGNMDRFYRFRSRLISAAQDYIQKSRQGVDKYRDFPVELLVTEDSSMATRHQENTSERVFRPVNSSNCSRMTRPLKHGSSSDGPEEVAAVPTAGSPTSRLDASIRPCRFGEGMRKDFSIKTGTFMRSSKIGYQNWLYAFYLFATNLKSVSSMKLHESWASRRSRPGTWHTGFARPGTRTRSRDSGVRSRWMRLGLVASGRTCRKRSGLSWRGAARLGKPLSLA